MPRSSCPHPKHSTRHTFKQNLAIAVEEFVHLVGVVGTMERNVQSVYRILSEWAYVVTGDYPEEFFAFYEFKLHVDLFYGVVFALTYYCCNLPEFDALCFALMSAVEDWEDGISKCNTGRTSAGVLCRCLVKRLENFRDCGMQRARKLKRTRQTLEPLAVIDANVLESVISALREAGNE